MWSRCVEVYKDHYAHEGFSSYALSQMLWPFLRFYAAFALGVRVLIVPTALVGAFA